MNTCTNTQVRGAPLSGYATAGTIAVEYSGATTAELAC
jgi:hypothetical protein